jgi:fructan beta-fructosidase
MNRVLKNLSLVYVLLFFACGNTYLENSTNKAGQDAVPSDYYREKHRPQFHFSPEANWMNDPNGMVYYEGEYHLFYQYYPEATVWGPMHWGHAVSTDLVHWEHLPIALYPDEHGLIFSGSAVVDWKNTSGFGKSNEPPLVAIFTYHDMVKERAGLENDFQTQGIAYSNDKGRSWTKYEGNPVIKNPGVRDFRDPKVFWHEDTRQWVMVVTALDHLKLYGSANLKEWSLMSEFGKGVGSHEGVWECPDLFPLKDEKGKEYWVILQNMNPGNPNGGSGLQYFIGDFDGRKFTIDKDFMQLLGTLPVRVPDGIVFEGFEKDYSQWTVEGKAFGVKPSHGPEANQQTIKGYVGKGLANSFHQGDGTMGSLTSKEFIIEKRAINFLIGGGNHRGLTYIALVVDGKQVREAEGKNTETLSWKGWDVANYIGKKAQIKIVDKYPNDWGHLNIDQITFADEVAFAEESKSVWLDAGTDNYAGVTWSDIPDSDGRRIFMGWMSNWAYAQVVPTEKWRSAMTIPWHLSIQQVNGIPKLTGNPVKEINKLHRQEKRTITAGQPTLLPASGLADITLRIDASKAGKHGFKLSNDRGQYVHFYFDSDNGKLFFDRTKSGDLSFSNDFPAVHEKRRTSVAKELKIRALVDVSSVEIFIDDGLDIFTEIFFPDEVYNKLELISSGAEEVLLAGEWLEVKRVW